MGEQARFYFRPAAGEQVSTVVHAEDDPRSAVSGVVVDSGGRAVEGALVLLSAGEETLSRAFTCAEGRFVFGPLEPDTLYLIRVYKNSLKLRELEIKTQ